jgi:hypothetical protein
MLERERHELIGRVAVAFGLIDFIIHQHTVIFSGIKDEELASVVVPMLNSFDQTTKRLRQLVERIPNLRPSESERVERIKQLLKKAEDGAQRRNKVIHGIIQEELPKREWGIVHKRETITSAEIKRLAQELDNIFFKLTEECDGLAVALGYM